MFNLEACPVPSREGLTHTERQTTLPRAEFALGLHAASTQTTKVSILLTTDSHIATMSESEVSASTYINFLQQFFELHRLIEQNIRFSESEIQALERDNNDIRTLLQQVHTLSSYLDDKLQWMQKYSLILRPYVEKIQGLMTRLQELQQSAAEYDAQISDAKKQYTIEANKLEAKIQALAQSQHLDAERIKEEVRKEYSKKIRETQAKIEQAEKQISNLRRNIDEFDKIVDREKEKISVEVEKEHTIRKRSLEKNIKRYKEKLAASKHEYEGRRIAEQTRFESTIKGYQAKFNQLRQESSELKGKLKLLGIEFEEPQSEPEEDEDAGGQAKPNARAPVSDQSKAKTPQKKPSKAVSAYLQFLNSK